MLLRHRPAGWFLFAAGLGLGLGVAAAFPLRAGRGEAVMRIDAVQSAHGGTLASVDPGASVRIGARTPLAGAYRAQILAVIDGDTLDAKVHVWMGQEVVTRIRLLDIDAPELGGGCQREKELARAARDRLAALLADAAPHGSVTLVDVRPDKYFGRVVGRVLRPDGLDLGKALVAEELGRPYRGGRRSGWCELAWN